MRTRRNFVGVPELVVRIVEFVNRLMMTICEDRRFTLVRVVIGALLGVVFGLDKLRNVFRDRIKVLLLQRACTSRAVLTATGVRL